MDGFRDGYWAAWTKLTLDNEALKESANRRFLSKLHPDASKYAEARTTAELEAEKPLLATAAGVAAAIRVALLSQ